MISDLQRQLGIDWTFFPQFLIFIGVFLWLRFVYFSPFLKLIQKRESSSDGAWKEVHKLDEASERLEREREAALASARKKAAGERDSVLALARKEANELISSARKQAKERLEKTRESAQKNAEVELGALKAQVSGLSALLVEKLTNTRVRL